MGIDSGIVTAILSSAGAGTAIICLLLITGVLATRAYTERIIRDADDWKTAYGDERKAHQATRDALVLASQRAEAAVETAKIAQRLLEETQRRRDTGRALDPMG